MAKYASKERIKIKLQSRLATNPNDPTIYFGQQTLNEDLLDIYIEENETWIDSYLGMIYEMPLLHQHSILSMIAEKLIISDIMLFYFEGSLSGVSGDPGFGAFMRQQGLNLFQSLFYGTGLMIPDAVEKFENAQNSNQLRVKFIPLPGERVKPFIGLDQDGDGLPDHELWSTSTTRQTVFLNNSDHQRQRLENRDRSFVPIDFYFRNEPPYDE